MASLTLKNIHKSFGKINVLSDINIDVADGEFVIFVGPSGCGKSTLLRIIAGLEEPDEGDILIGEQSVSALPPAKRGIAMVFQSYALYPHLSVRDNMGLALKQAGQTSEQIRQKTDVAANMLSLQELVDRRPAELSGGQRQRVAIGRALVREPDLFLFDEPLSNLDAALRANTRLEIAKLHRELGTTMIYVTHDQTEAMTLGDRIVVLNHSQIVQTGSPMELYTNPINQFVAGFIGSPTMNFIPATELGHPEAHRVGIRPEHILLDPNQGNFKAQIIHLEYLGADTNVYCDAGSLGTITVRVFGDHGFKTDAIVYLVPDSSRYLLFDIEGERL